MLPSAYGLGQYFQDLGHSFLPYGPPSRQITYITATAPGEPLGSKGKIMMSWNAEYIKKYIN